MAADIPFEIAIIGGGISGLILAIALQSRADSIPATITLYEQAAKFGEIGAGERYPDGRLHLRLASDPSARCRVWAKFNPCNAIVL